MSASKGSKKKTSGGRVTPKGTRPPQAKGKAPVKADDDETTDATAEAAPIRARSRARRRSHAEPRRRDQRAGAACAEGAEPTLSPSS